MKKKSGPKPRPAADRFWEKVDFNSSPQGCWLWTGSKCAPYGYGQFSTEQTTAHRWSYENAYGPIPKGHVVRQTCCVTACVNPAHLRLGTCSEFLKRAQTSRYEPAPYLDEVAPKAVGPCIERPGSKTHAGYGRGQRGDVNEYHHRSVWAEANGPIPEGMEVCHRCDHPSCSNLEHLFLDTRLGNILDCARKGRIPHGEGHWNARLTEETAVYAMARLLVGESQETIAQSFAVGRATIGALWTGRNWARLFKTKDTTHNT